MRIETAVIYGDGVGREMMEQARAVLQAVCQKYGHSLNLYPVPACGESIDAGGEPLPEMSLKLCQSVPAVLFGNSGLKKYQNLPPSQRSEAALMRLRKGIGVTTNIRPVILYPSLSEFSPLKNRLLSKGMDFVFVRDIVGGVLCSDKVCSQGNFGKEAYEYEYYNEKMVADTAQIAFDIASRRKKRLVNLDKSNVLESSRLWRQTVCAMAHKYPDVTLENDYIDHAAMRILEMPYAFDVLVTSNIFGDIISDEGTQMTGTPYLYASAEINKEGYGIYTPNQLHHPDESIIGKQIVNPIGMIAATALMLRYTFGLEQEAACIEKSVECVIESGLATRDIWEKGKVLLTTEEMGAKIVKEVLAERNG